MVEIIKSICVCGLCKSLFGVLFNCSHERIVALCWEMDISKTVLNS